MDCKKRAAHRFRAKLGDKNHDAILIKEKSVLKRIMSSFKEENVQTQCKVLGYGVAIFFHSYNWHCKNGQNNGILKKKQKTKKQNEIEQELGCMFFRIDPDKKGFGIFRTSNEIFKHIKISTKKTLKNKNSTRFLWSEFKSYDTIKAKPMN